MSCNCNQTYKKSCVRYVNNTAQTFAAGSTTVLTLAGAKVVKSGTAIEVEPQSYETNRIGLYHPEADVIILATASGAVTLQWYMDGIAVPSTIRTVTLPAAGYAQIHTETDLELSNCCSYVDHVFTLVLVADSTAAGSVAQLSSGMLKNA